MNNSNNSNNTHNNIIDSDSILERPSNKIKIIYYDK